jgi:L-ornithine N5-oxygenase
MLATMKTTTRPLNIAVVGAGQSAVEVLLNLNSRLTSMGNSAGQEHNLHLIVRGGSLKPSDGGPFANQIYNPEHVDVMYDLPSDSRRRAIADYKATNYGAVNPLTLNSVSCVSFGNLLRFKNATTALRSHV